MNKAELREMDPLDRMSLQMFLTQSLEFLYDEGSAYARVLEKIPGDIVSMGNLKRVESDLYIIEEVVKECQRLNLEYVEILAGKKFAYLLQNKDISKDVIKKA